MSTATLTNSINSLASGFDARTRRLAAALGVSLVYALSALGGGALVYVLSNWVTSAPDRFESPLTTSDADPASGIGGGVVNGPPVTFSHDSVGDFIGAQRPATLAPLATDASTGFTAGTSTSNISVGTGSVTVGGTTFSHDSIGDFIGAQRRATLAPLTTDASTGFTAGTSTSNINVSTGSVAVGGTTFPLMQWQPQAGGAGLFETGAKTVGAVERVFVATGNAFSAPTSGSHTYTGAWVVKPVNSPAAAVVGTVSLSVNFGSGTGIDTWSTFSGSAGGHTLATSSTGSTLTRNVAGGAVSATGARFTPSGGFANLFTTSDADSASGIGGGVVAGHPVTFSHDSIGDFIGAQRRATLALLAIDASTGFTAGISTSNMNVSTGSVAVAGTTFPVMHWHPQAGGAGLFETGAKTVGAAERVFVATGDAFSASTSGTHTYTGAWVVKQDNSPTTAAAAVAGTVSLGVNFGSGTWSTLSGGTDGHTLATSSTDSTPTPNVAGGAFSATGAQLGGQARLFTYGGGSDLGSVASAGTTSSTATEPVFDIRNPTVPAGGVPINTTTGSFSSTGVTVTPSGGAQQNVGIRGRFHASGGSEVTGMIRGGSAVNGAFVGRIGIPFGVDEDSGAASGTLANDDVASYKPTYLISPNISYVISIPNQDASTYRDATLSGIADYASLYASYKDGTLSGITEYASVYALKTSGEGPVLTEAEVREILRTTESIGSQASSGALLHGIGSEGPSVMTSGSVIGRMAGRF